MNFEHVLPALREGKAIQRTSQPASWAFLKKSPNGAFHWYGFGDKPEQAVPMNISHVELQADDWVIVEEDDAKARRPEATQTCPRRGESGQAPEQHHDYWRDRDGNSVCSYCGSLNPETFMARIEAGDVELSPTDKNYKVYIDGPGLSHAKFYFQHLNKEQKLRFIEIYNDKKMKLAFPGHFYRFPFFMAPIATD